MTTQTPAAGGRTPTLPAVGHHADWDGNRCRDCNAPLSDADLEALCTMQGPVISANDGACVCGAEDGLFADPDPQCGVGAHRLAALRADCEENGHPTVAILGNRSLCPCGGPR